MASATSSTSFHSLIPSNLLHPRRTPHFPGSYVTSRRRRPLSSSVSAVYTTTARPRLSFVPLTTSFYEVLGVQDGATCQEIKAAYRRLARVLHPDVVAANSNGSKEATSAADDFIRVHDAYVTLSDPEKRADYDKMLLFKRRRMSYYPNYRMATANYETTSTSSGYTRRSWETDQCW